jgi:hypothetical protein
MIGYASFRARVEWWGWVLWVIHGLVHLCNGCRECTLKKGVGK